MPVFPLYESGCVTIAYVFGPIVNTSTYSGLVKFSLSNATGLVGAAGPPALSETYSDSEIVRDLEALSVNDRVSDTEMMTALPIDALSVSVIDSARLTSGILVILSDNDTDSDNS